MPLKQVFNKLLFRGQPELSPQERPHYQPGRAFDTPHYEDVTRCRLDHLRTLVLRPSVRKKETGQAGGPR